MSLLVAVPSRGRPQNVHRLISAMRDTCTGNTTLLLGLDEDDPQLPAYRLLPGVSIRDNPVRIEVVVRAGLRQVVGWLNELTVKRAAEYQFTGHIGDDNVPSTPGWDTEIMKALDETPFAFGNDLNPGRPPGSLCCHVFCRSEVIGALGYLGPPSLRYSYVDDVWMRWGQACGITYLHNVRLEHRHYSTGAAEMDENYQRSADFFQQDQAAYLRYCADGLARDVAKIRAVL